MKFWKEVALCILFVEVLGNASGLITFGSIKDWYVKLDHPPGTPPNGIFGPVWVLLFGMMGYALALVLNEESGQNRTVALRWFFIQFILNLAWTPVFFGIHRIDFAFVIIVLMVLAIGLTIKNFAALNRLAGGLMTPYFLWVCYASYLNLGFWWLNN